MERKTSRALSGSVNAYRGPTIAGTAGRYFTNQSPASTETFNVKPDLASDNDELDILTLRRLESELREPALRRLINLFIEETRNRLQQIASAEARGDWQGLHREAHTLKSAAGAFGAKRLQEYARQLDNCCIHGDLEKTHALASAIGDIATPALEALARQYPLARVEME